MSAQLKIDHVSECYGKMNRVLKHGDVIELPHSYF